MIAAVMLVMVLTVVVAFLLPLLGRRAKARRETAAPVIAPQPPEAG